MCLAVPMQITEIKDGGMARVEAMGATRDIAIDLTPDAQVGDYVLVHAGCAIEVMEKDKAQEIIDLFADIDALEGLQ